MEAAAELSKAQTVAEGLRQRRDDLALVAEWLEQHAAELEPFYVHPTVGGVAVQVKSGEELATVARLLSHGAPIGSVTKKFTDGLAYVIRSFGSVVVKGYGMRAEVCERRVVGTETVEVPDPSAVLTVEREIVEWVCAPLLVRA